MKNSKRVFPRDDFSLLIVHGVREIGLARTDFVRSKQKTEGGICTDSSSIDYAPIRCGNWKRKSWKTKGFVFPKVCETIVQL